MRQLLFVLMVTLVTPRPSKAQIVVESPGIEALLSTEIGLASKTVAMQLKEIAEVTALVANVKYLLQSANDALALARSVKRVYDVVRNYSWKDLMRDAKAGLYEALPDLRDIEDEWGELRGNGSAIQDGQFWEYRSRHDVVSDERLAATASLAWRSTIYESVAPDLFEGRRTVPTSEAEKWVQLYFARAQMREQRAMQDSAFAIQAAKLKALIEDAEGKERADLKMQATGAAANHQTAVSTQFLRDAKAAEIAREQALEEAQRETTEADREEIESSEQSLLGIGILH